MMRIDQLSETSWIRVQLRTILKLRCPFGSLASVSAQCGLNPVLVERTLCQTADVKMQN